MAEGLAERLGDLTGDEFEAAGREVLQVIRDYYAHLDETPVLPHTGVAELQRLLTSPLPEDGTPFEQILSETKERVIPNLTLWNHPRFFAYFSTPGSQTGALADLLISSLNANVMHWKGSPAGTALEQVVLKWMAQMLGYDPEADGVLTNGASLSTFYALAAAREATGLNIREEGLIGRNLPVLRVYATEHAHNSIDKAVIALGLGLHNLVKIESDAQQRMRPDLLAQAIAADVAKGYRPMACVAVAGTTSTGAADPLTAIAEVCRQHNVWLHIDGAYGGFYNVVPGIRAQVDDLSVGDSLVANPHKGLFTPLEVSALYCKRKGMLAAAFSLVPEYLRTESPDGSVNYMDYTLQLGRSFRALKLWWIIRSFGIRGLQRRMEEHLRLARVLSAAIDADPDFERVSDSPYPLVCFRYFPRELRREYDGAGLEGRQAMIAQLERLNGALLERVNADGMQFLSHSKLRAEGYIIRVAIGNLHTTEAHMAQLWSKIQAEARAVASALS